MVAVAFQNVRKTNDFPFDICQQVVDVIVNPGQGDKVDEALGLVFSKGGFNRGSRLGRFAGEYSWGD
jgi:hypothetical protein